MCSVNQEIRELIYGNCFEMNFKKVLKKILGFDEEEEEYELAIIGNIIKENLYGQNKELRNGIKHFSGNTKVICLPQFGGMCHERMPVVGIHRKSKRLIKVVISTNKICLLYTSPSPRDLSTSRMPSSA